MFVRPPCLGREVTKHWLLFLTPQLDTRCLLSVRAQSPIPKRSKLAQSCLRQVVHRASAMPSGESLKRLAPSLGHGDIPRIAREEDPIGLMHFQALLLSSL